MPNNGGLLNWASSAYRFASGGQVANTDKDLHETLKSRYSRWQVWFDQTFPIDAIDENSLQSYAEYASEFIEENDEHIRTCVRCLSGDE